MVAIKRREVTEQSSMIDELRRHVRALRMHGKILTRKTVTHATVASAVSPLHMHISIRRRRVRRALAHRWMRSGPIILGFVRSAT